MTDIRIIYKSVTPPPVCAIIGTASSSTRVEFQITIGVWPARSQEQP